MKKELSKEKLGLVVVPMQDVNDLDEDIKKELKDVPMVKFGE